jgi:hypothetical protein
MAKDNSFDHWVCSLAHSYEVWMADNATLDTQKVPTEDPELDSTMCRCLRQ